jgi:hypothetical protein
VKSVSGTSAALSRVTEVLVGGSDAQPATVAERMRRCRARRAAGVVRVSFDLAPAGIADLITTGFLPATSRDDPKVVREAFIRAAVAGGLALLPRPLMAEHQERLGDILGAAIARRGSVAS